MRKHTPGPWLWMHPRGNYCSLIRDSTSEGVINIYIEVDIERDNALVAELDLTEADAQLIAAAPDLLAALEGLEFAVTGTSLESDGDYKAEIGAARSAIAKAKGV